MRKLFLSILCFTLIGCSESVPRKPLNKKKEVFLKKSADRNKKQVSSEQETIKRAITQDSLINFQASSYGFWFAYIKKEDENIPLPKKGDQLKFSYQIEDLNENLLYDEETLGEVTYFVDEEELLPGLREGLRIMRPHEVVVFLFPSYLCFSYQGDGEKIGINQPLRYTIHLKSLTKK